MRTSGSDARPAARPTPVVLPGRGETVIRDAGGPPDAPLVVLLHGWTSTSDLDWRGAYGELCRSFRVVALDLRGHGSGIRGRGRQRLETCADDVAALIGHLGEDRAVVVGYSMGGAVAQLTWRRHRHRVAGLVLCASACRFRGTWREWARFVGLDVAATLSRLLPDAVPRAIALWVMRLLFGASEFQRWVLGQVALHRWRAVLELGAALGRFDSTSWIDEVDVPVALLLTTRDEFVPPARQRQLAALTRARVFPVEGPHSVCLAQPRRFGAVLASACRQMSARRTLAPA